VSWVEAAARWYFVLAAISWAFAPGIWWLCRSLADRGATIARPIAMLAALYPVWLLASLGILTFRSAAVVGFVLVAGASGWVTVIRRREVDRRWLRDLCLTEVASMALFASYIWLRGYTPQILGTEKPMDVAFLASSTRTVTMPPPDPWFAGEPINYYYLGYLLHGTVGRLARVVPETGFNLALATVFSMTAVAAFGVAWNAVRPWLGSRLAAAAGLLALFLVTLSGNLYAPRRLLEDAAGTVSAWWWDGVNGIGWRSSRIVCDGPRVGNLCSSPATETINEFPFFSFLLGDLHPHVMALPYTLVVIGLAWNLALVCKVSAGGLASSGWIRVAIVGVIVGSLYALNAWDFPTYLLLVAVGIWMGAGARIVRAWKPILLLLGASVAAWLPFFATYVPPTVDGADRTPSFIAALPLVDRFGSVIGLHLGERTSIAEYVTVFGVQYALGLTLVVSGIRNRDSSRISLQRSLLTSSVVTIFAGVLLAAPVIPLCGIPLALAIAQLRGLRSVSPRWFALALVSFAWALSIAVEFIYVRDVFEDRMNTLFKFYYQAWTLYGLASAMTFALIWGIASERDSRWQKPVLAVAAIAAFLAGAAYPTVASFQWTDRFQTWRGLDGVAYGEETNPDDTAAIYWLSDHSAPGDIVLEAAGCSYHPFDRLPFNRVSAFTGVPSVIGWANNHQRQWRAGQPMLIDQIERRQADVIAMFADPNSSLFEKYGVNWLFVGDYESGDWKATCATAGPYEVGRFSDAGRDLWNLAFQSGDTRIYRRAGT
jgi:YYY domain-containing protein